MVCRCNGAREQQQPTNNDASDTREPPHSLPALDPDQPPVITAALVHPSTYSRLDHERRSLTQTQAPAPTMNDMSLSARLVFVLLLSVQLYFPLRYYYLTLWLAPQDSDAPPRSIADYETLDTEARLAAYDERFAWRMFSSRSVLERCDVSFHDELGNVLDITSQLHVAWSDLLALCRWSVIDAVTRETCKRAQPSQPSLFRTIVIRMLDDEPPSEHDKQRHRVVELQREIQC